MHITRYFETNVRRGSKIEYCTDVRRGCGKQTQMCYYQRRGIAHKGERGRVLIIGGAPSSRASMLLTKEMKVIVIMKIL